MKESDLKELLELERKLYTKISETINLTQDLMDSIERNDQVSLDIFLSLRQRPIYEMEEIQSYVSLKRVDLSEEDSRRFDALFADALPETPSERPLTNQLSMNRRLLDRLRELDRQVSRKLCGDQSFYRSE